MYKATIRFLDKDFTPEQRTWLKDYTFDAQSIVIPIDENIVENIFAGGRDPNRMVINGLMRLGFNFSLKMQKIER